MNETDVKIAIVPEVVADSTVVGEIVDLADTEKHFLAVIIGEHVDGDITVEDLNDRIVRVIRDELLGGGFNGVIERAA